MPLICDDLTVWDISFRWANSDPDKAIFPVYSLEVKDNFKLLMGAILSGELYCDTLTLVKRPVDSKADPKYYIRTHIDDVYDCIWGKKYNKQLLKWAMVSRYEFKEWCERRAIPLPEFWFPAGWKEEFEWPEFGTRASWASHNEPDEEGGFSIHFNIPEQIEDNQTSTDNLVDVELNSPRANQVAKICAQQIASNMWKESPDRKIAEMMKDETIQKYSGAANYGESALRKWLSEVAPVNIKGKRGRPRKKPD